MKSILREVKDMKMTNETFIDILSSFPSAPPECGGIIGGQDGVISRFCFDNKGSEKQAVYEPNADYLNRIIEEWSQSGISFYGIIHSHMKNEPDLSRGDIEYIQLVMADLDVGEKLYFPIVMPGYIIPFVATKTENTVNIQKEELDVLFR